MHSLAIIIRTFNEEKWIRHCLEACESQNTSLKINIVLIDTGSEDYTLQIINEKGYKFLKYEGKYIPGKVLNQAISSIEADFYVILSSHCIPANANWVQNLINPMLRDKKIAGVFGRQIPLPNSLDIDKRDLLMTFGCESRYQYKDPFFHNANSALRGELIKKTKFCELQTNAEDRIWAKEMLADGYCLFYESEAMVFHHHGLHQGSPPARVSGVLKSISRTAEEDLEYFPDSMELGNLRISFLILIPEYLNVDMARIEEIVKCLKKYKGKGGEIVTISKDKLKEDSFSSLIRNELKTKKDESISNLIYEVCNKISADNCAQDYFFYLNLSYNGINDKNINKLIRYMRNSNFDMCTFAEKAYSNLWYLNKDEKNNVESYKPIEKKLLSSEYRETPYRALYGLGSIINLKAVREGKFPADITGLLEPEPGTDTSRNRKT